MYFKPVLLLYIILNNITNCSANFIYLPHNFKEKSLSKSNININANHNNNRIDYSKKILNDVNNLDRFITDDNIIINKIFNHDFLYTDIKKNTNNECPDTLINIINIVNKHAGEDIVKELTSFLPKVDGIGGFILHSNDVMINKILNTEMLSTNIKKNLILNIIEISQIGDNTGSKILQLYHDLVNCLL